MAKNQGSEKKPANLPSEIITIVSSIMFVISFIADAVGVFEKLKIVFQILMVISAIFMISCAVYFIKNGKRYKELESEKTNNEKRIQELLEKLEENNMQVQQLQEDKKKLEEANCVEREKNKRLELEVCDGKQYLSNKATIVFDITEKKYKLSFEKRYIIISDAIKWYEGQFYSNKYLENAETSQGYYGKNPVQWNELNLQGELKYKNRGDKKFSQTKEVAILQIAEGNNYKKFHIQYRTKNGNDKLPIAKGAEIILNYSYEIPIGLWGSYLNRYISYWKEDAVVTLKCKRKDVLKEDNIKVYRTDHITGEPFIIDIDIDKDIRNGETSLIIKLPNNESCKYSIWWDAEEIFGLNDLNTNMTVDNSQQTQY